MPQPQRQVRAAIPHLRVLQQLPQRVRHPRRREAARREKIPRPQPLQALRVVRLIVRHRHHQLRHPGGEPLTQRAHPAMMHEGGRLFQQRPKRHVRRRVDRRGQVARELGQIPRHQHARTLQPLQRRHRRRKKRRRLHVRAARREHHRRPRLMPRQEGAQVSGQRLLRRQVLERKRPLQPRLRPVRLRRCQPLREQQQRAVRRVPPLIEKLARRFHPVQRAQPPQRRPAKNVQRVRPVPEQQLLHRHRQQAQQRVQRRHQHRRVVRAQDHRRLQVHRHQRQPPLFPRQPCPERRHRRQQQVRPPRPVQLRRDRLKITPRRQRGVLKHRLRANPEPPHPRIADQRLELLIGTDRHKRDARAFDRFFEQARRDQQRLMPARPQLPRQPHKRQHVPCGAKRKQRDVQAIESI